MKKNTAGQYICCQLTTAAGSAVTSGTTTVNVTIDGGTQGSGSGTIAHNGNGLWTYAATQADTNGNNIVFQFLNAAAVTSIMQVYTIPYDATSGYPRVELKAVNSVTVNGNGSSTPWGP